MLGRQPVEQKISDYLWIFQVGDVAGFPYLSEAGRLVLKDVSMLARSVLMIADSAKQLISGTSLVNPGN